jgi:phosphatidate cytidylyltransferase
MGKRISVAFIVLPLLYLFITRSSFFFFFLFLSAASFICQVEFLNLYKVDCFSKYAASVLGILPIYFTYTYGEVPMSFMALVFLVIVFLRLFAKKTASGALYDIAPFIASILYIPILLCYFIKLRAIGPELIIYLFLVIWCADSFALYIGKYFGKRKLYVEMSPNKTIEGALAALFGAVFASTLLRTLLGLHISLEKAVLIGLSLGIVGIVGDLAESMFKRDGNVKDSGSFLPGHGGMLDKIDGMLPAAPVLYFTIILSSSASISAALSASLVHLP